LNRNYLKGILGGMMNLMLSAAAINFKQAMKLWSTEAIGRWKLICLYLSVVYWNYFAQKLKVTF